MKRIRPVMRRVACGPGVNALAVVAIVPEKRVRRRPKIPAAQAPRAWLHFRILRHRLKLMEQFSPEIIAILAVGVAIAGLVLQQGRRLDRRIDVLSLRMDDRFRQMNDQMNEQFRQMNEQFRQMDEQLRNLSDRVARVEGKLDLLESFITRRNEPPVMPVE